MRLPLHKYLFDVNTNHIFFEGGETPTEGAGNYDLEGMISEWLVDPEFRMEKVAQELDEGNLNIQDLQQIVELLEADIQKGDFEAASLQEEIQALIKSENKKGRGQEKVESQWGEFAAAVEAENYETATIYIPGLDQDIVGVQEKMLKIAEKAPAALASYLRYLNPEVIAKMAEIADVTTLVIDEFNKQENYLFQLKDSLSDMKSALDALKEANVSFDKEAIQKTVNKKVLTEIKKEASEPWNLWARNTEVADIVSKAKEAGLALDLDTINSIFLQACKELISMDSYSGPDTWFLAWSGVDDLKQAGIGEGIDPLANKQVKKYLSKYSKPEDAIHLDGMVDHLESAGISIDPEIKTLTDDPAKKTSRETLRNSGLVSRSTRLLDQKKYSEMGYEVHLLSEAAKKNPEATTLLLRFVQEAPSAIIKDSLIPLIHSPNEVAQALNSLHDVTGMLEEITQEALDEDDVYYAVSSLVAQVAGFEEQGIQIDKYRLSSVVDKILNKKLTQDPDEILPYRVTEDVKSLLSRKFPFDIKAVAFEVNSRILEKFPSDDFEYAYSPFYSIKEAVIVARKAGIPLEMEQIEEQTNQLIRGYVAYGGDTKQAKYLDDMIDDAKKAGIRLHPNVLELQLK